MSMNQSEVVKEFTTLIVPTLSQVFGMYPEAVLNIWDAYMATLHQEGRINLQESCEWQLPDDITVSISMLHSDAAKEGTTDYLIAVNEFTKVIVPTFSQVFGINPVIIEEVWNAYLAALHKVNFITLVEMSEWMLPDEITVNLRYYLKR